MVTDVEVRSVAGMSELAAARRFQAQRYLEAQYVTTQDISADGVVDDPWVPFSDYFTAHDVDGEMLGTCRMIRPSPLGLQTFAKATLYPETVQKFSAVPAWACVEISALATSRKRARTSTALYVNVWREAVLRRHVYMFAFMDSRVVKVLRGMFASPFEQIGPTLQFMGSETVPVVMHIPTSILVYTERRPDLYNLLEDALDGRGRIDQYVIDLRDEAFGAPEIDLTTLD